MKINATLAVAAMIVLSACAGQKLGEATETTPQGTAFDNALSAGYLQLARDEYAEGDYADSDYFAIRSMEAGSGLKVVLPPEAMDRDLPASDAPYVASARNELIEALDSSARTRVPEKAAEAQIAYECWIQELEENFQPDHIAACRDRLDALMPELRAAPAARPAAKAPKGGLFKVYFATGSARLDDTANATIGEAATLTGAFGSARIAVSGYTDSAGSKISNERLSQRRAAAVAAALRARGIARDAIRVRGYGERFPDVKTGDGATEARNRRVEISVAP